MLDAGVSAQLLLRTEHAVGLGDVRCFKLLLLKVGTVEEETLHFLPESVVQEGLAQLHVAVHDALLQHLLQLVVVQVGVDQTLIIPFQTLARLHPLVVCDAVVRSPSPHDATVQKSPHFYPIAIFTLSEFVVQVQHGEVPDFEGVGTHEHTVFLGRIEVLDSLDYSVPAAEGLIESHPHEEARAKVRNSPHEADLSPGSCVSPAPGAELDGAGEFAEVVGVVLFGFDDVLGLLEEFGVFLDLLLLPLSEVLRQLLVVRLAHHVFLHAFEAFDLLVDGARVEVVDVEDHSGFSPIEAQGTHIIGEFSNEFSLGGLELQLEVGHEGAEAGLDVLLHGEDGLRQVVAGLDHLQRTDVVLNCQLHSRVLREGLHSNQFKTRPLALAHTPRIKSTLSRPPQNQLNQPEHPASMFVAAIQSQLQNNCFLLIWGGVGEVYFKSMINDMQSVRSLPIRSSQKQQARTHMPAPSIFSPSENSPLNSRAHRDWRNNLLPEIDEKYNRIMRGEQVKWAEGEGRWERWQGQGEERGGSTAKSSGGEALRREYEAKINALEEQNSNLKEELYYLREALLINFQNRKEK